MEDYRDCLNTIIQDLENMEIDSRITALNEIRGELHKVSPFKNEPVDYVRWAKQDLVGANDYNPSAVAPPEMELLTEKHIKYLTLN